MLKRLAEEGRLEGGDAVLAEWLRVLGPLKGDPFGKSRVLVKLERAGFRRSPGSSPQAAIVAMLVAGGSAAAELTLRIFRHTPPR